MTTTTADGQPVLKPATDGVVSIVNYRNARGQQIEEQRQFTGNPLVDAVTPARYVARAQGAVEVGPPGRERHAPVPFTCIIPASNPLDAFAKLDECLQQQGTQACEEAKAEYERMSARQQLTTGLSPGGIPLRLPKGKGG